MLPVMTEEGFVCIHSSWCAMQFCSVLHTPCPDDQEQQYGRTGSHHKLSFSMSLDSALKTFKFTTDTQSYHLPAYSMDPSEVSRSQGPTHPGLPICLAETASLGLPSVALLEPVSTMHAVISYAPPRLDPWTFC